MARLGADQELEYILFSSLPLDLAKALEDDRKGVFFNRLCTNLDVMFWVFMKSSFNPKKKKKILKFLNIQRIIILPPSPAVDSSKDVQPYPST